jgi:Domain of unknown function (DUF4505)
MPRNRRFASIVKTKAFYKKHARTDIAYDGTRNIARCYFYNIDLQGRLFLEEALPKNIATCIKDNRFLDFFFKRLKRTSDGDREWMIAHDIPVDDYPFVSMCGNELNLIRPAASPIVFHSLVENGERHDLVFGGSSLVQPFDEIDGIAISEQTGRLYHKVTTHSLVPRGSDLSSSVRQQEYGLIRSSVAVTLSERIVVMEDCTNNTETTTHSGMGFETGRRLAPISWLPADAEPGSWAMPFTEDE